MSWNNVIPAELLLGTVQIVHKELENPEVIIPLDCVCDVRDGYQIGDYAILGYVDHPSFASMRKALDVRGYIEAEYGWHNGDRVKKRFRFNGIQLEPGDKFYCAAAWQYYKKDMNEV